MTCPDDESSSSLRWGTMLPVQYSVGRTAAQGVGGMHFILTYEGQLRGSTDPVHQHDMRRWFRSQLQYQWSADETLNRISGSTGGWEKLAARHSLNDYQFLPLVSKRLKLACRLDIVLLRPEEPGGVMIMSGAVSQRAGTVADIDNRMKVLFDSLTIPKKEQVAKIPCNTGENPFFCLLEDDSLISGFSVRAERLLKPACVGHVFLIIEVTVMPTAVTEENMAFLSGRL